MVNGTNGAKKKFLFVSNEALVGDLAWKVKNEGNDVKYFIGDKEQKDVCDGFIEKVEKWEDFVDWADIIVFDDICFGAESEKLRKAGKLVVGGSVYGDKLEVDRDFGHNEMISAGISVIPSWFFTDFDEAIKFIQKNPDRYVIKPSGEEEEQKELLFVGEEDDGMDVIRILELYKAKWSKKIKAFQLQKHISGVEIAVGAFFNGNDFIYPINVNFEHKKLFPGNIGPSTGEMGTSMYWSQPNVIFNETLFKMKDKLKQEGYIGYIDINNIVNGKGIYPLEFTCIYGPKTNVFTSKGWKSICKIRENDLVLTHKGRFRKVLKKMSFSDKSVVEIFVNKERFQFTPEHPILTESGWKKAVDLKESDKVVVKAIECKECGKLIPDMGLHRRKFCSSSCSSKNFMSRIGDDYRKRLSDGQKQRWLKWDSKLKQEFSKKQSGITRDIWRQPSYRELQMKKFSSPKMKNALRTAMEKTHAIVNEKIKTDEEFARKYKITQHNNGRRVFAAFNERKEELIRKRSESLKIRYREDADFYNRRRKLMLKARKLSKMKIQDTSIEIAMKDELERREVKFEHPYCFKFNLDSKEKMFILDFAIPEKKIAIECDGDYWHSLPNVVQNDKLKDECLSLTDWTVLRFSESEIKRSVAECADEVERIIKNHEGKLDKFVSVKIDRINKFERKRKQPVFNLQVEGDESFITRGLVTHNCRFGYPTISIQMDGVLSNWGEFLTALAKKENFDLKTRKGFQVGVVLAVPPFPFYDTDSFKRYSEDATIVFKKPSLEGVHLGDVKLVDGNFVLAGNSGYALVIVGIGTTMEESRKAVYNKISNITVPNMFYRTDIGERWFTDSDKLFAWGYI